MVYSLITNLLSLLIMICSILIVCANNRIYSILYLILIYMCSSLLFMYIGASILGLLYFLVYIGAVAVLFLFSVMILNINISLYEKDYSVFFNIYFTSILIAIFVFISIHNSVTSMYNTSYEHMISLNDSLRIIGLVMFGEYQMVLILCSMILLISMVGAILLTNRKTGFFVRKRLDPSFRNRYLYNISIY